MATIMRNIGEIWRCANLFRMEEYEELGIGSYQDSYLVDICKHPGVTQEQLSKIMYVHKSNVARQVGSLEEKGFVERRPDPSDRRNLLLYPTEKAAADWVNASSTVDNTAVAFRLPGGFTTYDLLRIRWHRSGT